MAFLSIRLVATAAAKSANANLANNIKKCTLSSALDRQIGSVARFSSVVYAPQQKHYELQQRQQHHQAALLNAAIVSDQHVSTKKTSTICSNPLISKIKESRVWSVIPSVKLCCSINVTLTDPVFADSHICTRV